ncbi:hypothetical protein FRB98_003301 [Tulasnella sp. 332]|nr:hypothetical protein FRB98_003301 [Tulasnella sp. 332]
MGKKTANPADAHRKALKKKEKEKNKEVRTKVREVKTLKSDTGGLETEIRRIEESRKDGELDSNTRKKLTDLQAEVNRIKKTKSEYVAAHPEHRKLIYGEGKSNANSSQADDSKGPFDKNGLPRYPERSIYYDPVLNPYGMPPPGMPYAERPLLPHEQAAVEAEAALLVKATPAEVSQSDGSDEDDDDDTPLPAGPPPNAPLGTTHSEEDASSDEDEDEIPMPPGPPPPKSKDLAAPPLPPGPPPPMHMTPFPPLSMPHVHQHIFLPPPSLSGFPSGASNYPNFPPPLSFPPPLGMPMSSHPYAYIPPPPPGFPPPPIGNGNNFPRQLQQQHDPLSDRPHRAYQDGGRASGPGSASRPTNPSSVLPPLPPGMNHPLPAPPISNTSVSSSTSVQPRPSPVTTTTATISAEPQLRDLKKESTAFVPAALKRKKPPPASAGGGSDDPSSKKIKVNAAAAVGEVQEAVVGVKPNLMTALRSSALGDRMLVAEEDGGKQKQKQADDYEAFLAEVGDIL